MNWLHSLLLLFKHKKRHGLQKEPPFFSQKNAQDLDTSLVFPYSPQTSDMRHEIELVVGLKHE